MNEVDLSLLDLLFFPVLLPARGFVFILEQLRDAVDRERFDPDTIRKRLIEEQLRYEMGEVSEADHERALAALSALWKGNGA